MSLPFFAPRDLLPAGAATSAGGGGAASAGAASFGEGGSDQKMGEAQELSDDVSASERHSVHSAFEH